MDRILASPRPSGAVRSLERLGLLSIVLPELDPLRGLVQNRYHHLDAFDHTLAAVEAADDPRGLARGLLPLAFATDPLAPASPDARAAALTAERARLLRWSLLLHDTGKAETRTRGEDGEYHFYLHDQVSARIARGAMRRLRASRAETSAIERLVFLHLRVSIPATGGVSPRALRRIVRDAGPLTPLLALHSLADKAASQGPGHARTMARLRRACRELIEAWRVDAERMAAGPPLVTGRDVMKVIGIGPGPEVGRRLEEIAELRGSGALTTRDEALRHLASGTSPAKIAE
jgi:tRNA nucleotidyltransferase/poly(A) polymerase